jgi:hypothetical protein
MVGVVPLFWPKGWGPPLISDVQYTGRHTKSRGLRKVATITVKIGNCFQLRLRRLSPSLSHTLRDLMSQIPKEQINCPTTAR